MKRVDQRINVGQAVFFRNISEVGISCSGHGTGMTKNCLDMTKA
jgi:hypothetical protein